MVKLAGKYFLRVAAALGFAFLFALCYSKLHDHASVVRQQTAVEVLKALYDFGTEEQLEAQQLTLRSRVTDEVFNQVSVDNEERRLNTYLKFYGEASTVNILKITDDYIIYGLDCIMIDSKRRFLFVYDTNLEGKINKVYEAELIGFMAGEKQWDWLKD